MTSVASPQSPSNPHNSNLAGYHDAMDEDFDESEASTPPARGGGGGGYDNCIRRGVGGILAGHKGQTSSVPDLRRSGIVFENNGAGGGQNDDDDDDDDEFHDLQSLPTTRRASSYQFDGGYPRSRYIQSRYGGGGGRYATVGFHNEYVPPPVAVISSIKGMGARKLGFRVVADVKKLQKKERSLRRLKRNSFPNTDHSAATVTAKGAAPTSAPAVTTAAVGGGGGGESEPLLAGGGGSVSGKRGSLIHAKDTSGRSVVSFELDKASPVSGRATPDKIYKDGACDDDGEDSQDLESKIFSDETSTDGAKVLPSLPSGLEGLYEMLCSKHINLLLVFVPFGYLSHHLQWPAASIFWCNFMAMIPLASILGDFTEDLAAHTNQVIGGLINATFGNAVEVVVAIQALLADEIRVVQASMIGSIFSNLLLVLGGCFFFGGLRYKEQYFNSTAATANMALLALSSVALVLPTPFAEYYDIEEERVLIVSRFAAVFLMLMYIQLLIFQLRTHADLFEDDDDEVPELPFWVALLGLCCITGLIAVLSDYLVGSIDGFVESSNVSRTFVGLIIIPIVGNAVEHMTAVSVAMKDKMDLAMGVAVGSCTQISLFVVPLTVLIGWACDKNMTLNFPHFEIILFIMSVVTVSICLSNPKGNWLEGSLLMTTYVMIAVGFWYEKVVDF